LLGVEIKGDWATNELGIDPATDIVPGSNRHILALTGGTISADGMFAAGSTPGVYSVCVALPPCDAVVFANTDITGSKAIALLGLHEKPVKYSG